MQKEFLTYCICEIGPSKVVPFFTLQWIILRVGSSSYRLTAKKQLNIFTVIAQRKKNSLLNTNPITWHVVSLQHDGVSCHNLLQAVQQNFNRKSIINQINSWNTQKFTSVSKSEVESTCPFSFWFLFPIGKPAKPFECALLCQSDYICRQSAKRERDLFDASLFPVTSKVRQKLG